MTILLIRDMRPEEADAVSRIYALSWKAGYRGIVPQEHLDALQLNNWTDLLATGAMMRSFVLEQDGRLRGTCGIAPARDEALAGWGEIVSLYVLPEYWGRGYGGALLYTACEALQEDGFHDCYLWVLEQNTQARAFYKKHGFTATGEELALEIGGRELAEVRYVRHSPAGFHNWEEVLT